MSRSDQVVTVGVDKTVSFGRSPNCTFRLDVDRNDENLSRVTGVLRFENGRWQVQNESGRLDLMVDIDGGIRSTIQPGAWPLVVHPGSSGTICVRTTRTYLMRFQTAPESPTGKHYLVPDPLTYEKSTSDLATTLRLTDSERAMLAVLCESRLRDPSSNDWSVPSTKHVCERLGISQRKAEDIVDGITAKLSSVLEGLYGDNSARATHRRQRVADFAYQSRCVTFEDLRRLPGAAPSGK